jgi:hypothetical protein
MSLAHGTLESGVRGDLKASPLDARRPVFHVSRDHGFTCSPIEAKALQIGVDRSETMHDLVEGELDIDSIDPSSARTASTSGRWPYRQSLDVGRCDIMRRHGVRRGVAEIMQARRARLTDRAVDTGSSSHRLEHRDDARIAPSLNAARREERCRPRRSRVPLTRRQASVRSAPDAT